MQPEIYVTADPSIRPQVIKTSYQIAAAGKHSVALDATGAVVCFGEGSSGQNGSGGTELKQPTPTKVANLDGASAVGAGLRTSYAIVAGLVWAWGDNAKGQLGVSPDQESRRELPGRLPQLTHAVKVSGGWWHGLALNDKGVVYAWGDNDAGQLGLPPGQPPSRDRAQPVPGLPPVHDIAAGAYHNLALALDGRVWAWGKNEGSPPQPVVGLEDIRAVAAGQNFSLALTAEGEVWAWGDNRYHQLGASSGPTPSKVLGLPRVVSIAAGAWHGVALSLQSEVWCWGAGTVGQLGDGSTAPSSAQPVAVKGLSGVAAVVANGGHHAFAVKDDGSVWGWGYNNSGQIGVASPIRVTTPVRVPLMVAKPQRPKPQPYTFDSVEVGQKARATFTIENYGTYPLRLDDSAIRFSGSDAALFEVTRQPGATTIEPGATTTFEVTFAPNRKARAGIKDATLVVSSNDLDTPTFEIPLSATATAAPKPEPQIAIEVTGATMSDDEVDFGDQSIQQHTDATFKITNTGNADLSLDGDPPIKLADESEFEVLAQPSPAKLKPEASATFVIRFTPTASGKRSTAAIVANNARPNLTLDLVGEGLGPEVHLSVNGQDVDLEAPSRVFTAPVGGMSATETIVLRNTGKGELLLTSNPTLVLDGADQQEFRLTGMAASPIPEGQSQTFSLQFTPHSMGSKTATLTISTNDPVHPTITLVLTGEPSRGAVTPLASRASAHPGAFPPLLVCTADGQVVVVSHVSPRLVTAVAGVTDAVAVEFVGRLVVQRDGTLIELDNNFLKPTPKRVVKEIAGAVDVGRQYVIERSYRKGRLPFAFTNLCLCADGSLWTRPPGASKFVKHKQVEGVTAMAGGLDGTLLLKSDGSVWRVNAKGEVSQWRDLTECTSVAVSDVGSLPGNRGWDNVPRWACVLRHDGTILASGESVGHESIEIEPPSGVTFQSVQNTGDKMLCAIDTESQIWVRGFSAPGHPPRQWTRSRFPPSVTCFIDSWPHFAVLTTTGHIWTNARLFSIEKWKYLPDRTMSATPLSPGPYQLY